MFMYPTVSVLTVNSGDSLSASFYCGLTTNRVYNRIFGILMLRLLIASSSLECTLLKSADLFYAYSYILRTLSVKNRRRGVCDSLSLIVYGGHVIFPGKSGK